MENTKLNKDRLFMRVMSGKAAEGLKNEFPCDSVLDITVGYRWLNVQEDGIRTSEPLKIEELEKAKLDRDELFKLAQKNTGNLFKTRLYKLADLVKRICEGSIAEDYMSGDEKLDQSEIYVCTNDSGMFGAAVMLMADVLKNIAERLGGNIYILPSSIHEVIIVPQIEAYDLKMLCETVKGVNDTVVNETDFLSDSVYRYELETGKVEIAA
jgi:hypothetical protein